METTSLPYFKANDGYIVKFEIPEYFIPKHEEDENSLQNLTRGEFNGYLSPKTRKKIKEHLRNWLKALQLFNQKTKSKGKQPTYIINFTTLTLPSKQKHDDNYIKRSILHPFIHELKEKHNVVNYFWRAEKQENGNLHFHIVIDRYIKFSDFQACWNRYMFNYDYVKPYSDKRNIMYPYEIELLESLAPQKRIKLQENETKKQAAKIIEKYKTLPDIYKHLLYYEKYLLKKCKDESPANLIKRIYNHKKNGFDQPPTCHVKEPDDITYTTAYVTKYMTDTDNADYSIMYERKRGTSVEEIARKKKLSQEQVYQQIDYIDTLKVQGRLWGCSDSVREAKDFFDVLCDDFYTYLNRTGPAGLIRKSEGEHYTIYFGKHFELSRSRSPGFHKNWSNHLINTYIKLYECKKCILKNDCKCNIFNCQNPLINHLQN